MSDFSLIFPWGKKEKTAAHNETKTVIISKLYNTNTLVKIGQIVFLQDRVQGAGCRVQGAGCRVQGAGCRGREGAECPSTMSTMSTMSTPFNGGAGRTEDAPPSALPCLLFLLVFTESKCIV
jgi:hypothetical protein